VAVIVNLIFIFLARVMDVSIGTIRLLMVMRGQRFLAATLGFFEIIIYILALSRVVTQLDQPLNLFVYALGFAGGTLIGSYIEERLAVGYILVEVIPKTGGEELASKLRQENFGVTLLRGEGRDGPRNVLHITLSRKNLPDIYRIVDKLTPNAFITVFDAKRTIGGFLKRK
jgi:uncharacterized protein YebE (UPF0316 family)